MRRLVVPVLAAAILIAGSTVAVAESPSPGSLAAVARAELVGPVGPPAGDVAAFGPAVPSGSAQAFSGNGQDPDWLVEWNGFRLAAGLQPVVNEPQWEADLQKHFLYLTKTPWDLKTGQYANLHTENPASPWYTPEGDAAGRSSNLINLEWYTPVQLVDGFLQAPFHALGMLAPNLHRVTLAIAEDPACCWSGLMVGRGFTDNPPVPGPILFPGPDVSTHLTAWNGAESPNPLTSCGWGSLGFWNLVGSPLIAMLQQEPAVGMTATLVADNGKDFSSANGSLCIVNKHTWTPTDPVYGPTGAAWLNSSYGPVFLVPKEPLTYSRYTATIKQPGRPDIRWSFVAQPAWEMPSSGQAVTVHVTTGGAQTVIGNLTVTEPQGSGFTTVYPCQAGRPLASNNNYVWNQTIPNLVVAQTDANGDICLYTSQAAHVIWDQVAETDAFDTHVAQRLLDTREAGGKVAAGRFRKVHVASGAQTVIGNLTVTEPSAAGFTTVYPCAEGRPLASNNNYVKGQTIPNLVVAKADANGDICLYTSQAAHLIWDQVAETTAFDTHVAQRLLDTRIPEARWLG